MTKRRLTDLLREEAQKTSVDVESDSPQDASRRSTNVDEPSTAKPVAQPAKTSTKPVVVAETPADTSSKSAENLAYIQQVAELKTLLETSQKQEAVLKQQVADLKQELKTNLASAEKLQASHANTIAKMAQAKTEVETDRDAVKKDNLRLAEANIQLTAEIDRLNAGKQPAMAARSQHSRSTQAAYYSSVKPALEKTVNEKAAIEQAKTDKASTAAHEKSQDKIRLSKLMRRPVGSNQGLSNVNGQNIGWFD
jgi:cell division protein FtsB